MPVERMVMPRSCSSVSTWKQSVSEGPSRWRMLLSTSVQSQGSSSLRNSLMSLAKGAAPALPYLLAVEDLSCRQQMITQRCFACEKPALKGTGNIQPMAQAIPWSTWAMTATSRMLAACRRCFNVDIMRAVGLLLS